MTSESEVSKPVTTPTKVSSGTPIEEEHHGREEKEHVPVPASRWNRFWHRLNPNMPKSVYFIIGNEFCER